MAFKQKLLGTASDLVHLTELPNALRPFVDPAEPAQKPPATKRFGKGPVAGSFRPRSTAAGGLSALNMCRTSLGRSG